METNQNCAQYFCGLFSCHGFLLYFSSLPSVQNLILTPSVASKHARYLGRDYFIPQKLKLNPLVRIELCISIVSSSCSRNSNHLQSNDVNLPNSIPFSGSYLYSGKFQTTVKKYPIKCEYAKSCRFRSPNTRGDPRVKLYYAIVKEASHSDLIRAALQVVGRRKKVLLPFFTQCTYRRHSDRQTDRQTERQTDSQSEKYFCSQETPRTFYVANCSSDE